MTYKWHPEKIVTTDKPEEWAGNAAYTADALIRTAQLALENTGSGACTDEARVASAANTLEVALAFIAISIDGTDTLQQSAGVGIWAKDEAA